MRGAHAPRGGSGRRAAGDWGAHPLLPAIGAALVAVGVVWALASDGGRDQAVAVALAVFGLAPLICGRRWRHRLTADAAGLVVRGLLQTRRVPWSQVHSIGPVTRSRYGLSGTTLEIDLDDAGLIILGRIELGADPVDVARALHALRLH